VTISSGLSTRVRAIAGRWRAVALRDGDDQPASRRLLDTAMTRAATQQAFAAEGIATPLYC